MKKNDFIFLMILSFMIVLQPSQAWCWQTLGIYWEETSDPAFTIDNGTFPNGSDYANAVMAAFNAWNDIIGCKLTFHYGFGSCNANSNSDDKNCVGFYNKGWYDVLARCSWRHKFLDYNDFAEVDVVFDSHWNWVSYYTDYEISPWYTDFSLRGVAKHEFGHALGLGHYNGSVATMAIPYHHAFDSLHSDDKVGARYLYGNSEVDRDVGLTNFKIYNGSVQPISWSSHAFYIDQLPQNIGIEYTLENLGTVAENSVILGFYLSLDNNLDAGDIRVGDTCFNLPVHSIGTFQVTLFIPSTVPHGIYKVILRLDDYNTISESNENNNILPSLAQLIIGSNTPMVTREVKFLTPPSFTGQDVQILVTAEDVLTGVKDLKLYLDGVLAPTGTCLSLYYVYRTCNYITHLSCGTHNYRVVANNFRSPPAPTTTDVTENIFVDTPPTANFTISSAAQPLVGLVNEVFNFDASSSYDPDEPTANLQVRWDWNYTVNYPTYDTSFATTKTADHAYSSPGIYNVKLQVKDLQGATGSIIKTVGVYNTPLNASFSVFPPNGLSGTNFQFDASSTVDVEENLSIIQVRWDWNNDGVYDTSFSTNKIASKAFSGQGTYTVKMQAYNPVKNRYSDTSRAVFVNSCIDGTARNSCSANKPSYCNSALQLIANCQTCGCGGSQLYCTSSGKCDYCKSSKCPALNLPQVN